MKEWLTKEIKLENIILLILSIIACILSVLIFMGILTVKLKNDVSPNAFAWILLIVGIMSTGLSIHNIVKDKKIIRAENNYG